MWVKPSASWMPPRPSVPWCTTSIPVARASMSAAFLEDWKGKLVGDDYGGYKGSFALGVTEIGCMSHARRKLYDLNITSKSVVAEQALRYTAVSFEVEREVLDLEPDARRQIRQEKAASLMDAFHAWVIAQRELVHDGLGITNALD